MTGEVPAAGAHLNEFARGWRVVAGSLLGISVGVSSIYFYSLGVFIKPLAAEFGWGRGDASLGALVGTAGAAVVAIPVGRLVDRIGSIRVAIGSLLLLAAGFTALGALTSGLISFLAITVLLSLLTAGSSPLPYTRLVVAAFARRRGLALGVVLAGTGLGALLIPMLLLPFVAAHGWRAGYFALGGVVMVSSPIVWALLSRRESAPVLQRPVRLAELLGSSAFRLLAGIFFLASFAILGTLVQFVSMLTDWGLAPGKAGATAGLIGLSAIAGRLGVGLLLDRAPPLWVTAGVFVTVACALGLLTVLGAAFAAPGALMLGFGVGAEVDLIAFLVARYFSPVLYGQTYGALYAVFLVGGALGPAASGYLQQETGNYRWSLIGAAALLLLAAAVTLLLARWLRRMSPQHRIVSPSAAGAAHG
jgi:MFS family permease